MFQRLQRNAAGADCGASSPITLEIWPMVNEFLQHSSVRKAQLYHAQLPNPGSHWQEAPM